MKEDVPMTIVFKNVSAFIADDNTWNRAISYSMHHVLLTRLVYQQGELVSTDIRNSSFASQALFASDKSNQGQLFEIVIVGK